MRPVVTRHLSLAVIRGIATRRRVLLALQGVIENIFADETFATRLPHMLARGWIHESSGISVC